MIWQKIFSHLKKQGIEVYSPSTKEGECKSPYVVVKSNGLNKHTSFSTDIQYYSVMCYVPKNSYSKLEDYVKQVKEAMKGLFPMVTEAGQETPSYYDDSVKAHMISIEYKNNIKI